MIPLRLLKEVKSQWILFQHSLDIDNNESEFHISLEFLHLHYIPVFSIVQIAQLRSQCSTSNWEVFWRHFTKKVLSAVEERLKITFRHRERVQKV